MASDDPKLERETEDPIKALSAKDIPTRAAAARDLSKHGDLDVIPLLVSKAQTDHSPAVRLGTAGAAADILSRYRVGPRAALLDEARRRELLELFRGVDPGINAGLFSMLACIGLPEGVQRIVVGLRDPRGGVRVGAGVGLMRLCQSLAARGDAGLEAAVTALLHDQRLKPDALAEVARVCAAVGYHRARRAMAALDLGGAHGEVVQAALQVLDKATEPLSGAWQSDGRDAGEVNPNPDLPPALLVVTPEGALVHEGGGDWVVHLDLAREEPRRMFIRRVGEHNPAPALQALGRTWYAASQERLLDEIDASLDAERIDWRRDGRSDAPQDDLSRILLPLLPETGAGKRTAAVLHARADRMDDAFLLLEAAVTDKKAPADTWYFLGECLARRGRVEEAREAWSTAARKAKRKKDWFAVAARERLGE